MTLPEWISNLISSIVSVKAAVKAFFICIGLVVFWRMGIKFAEDNGLPEGMAYPILILLVCSVSYILVEVLNNLWIFIRRLKSKYKDKIAKLKQQENFQALVEATIPILPPEQLDMLKSLCDREQIFDVGGFGVVHLERQKYIIRIHTVSNSRFVYRINESVKKSLVLYLRREREKSLDNFSADLTKDEAHFLNLFFSESIFEGTRDSGVKMKPEIFRAGQSMSSRGFLKQLEKGEKIPNKESFLLLPDTSDCLEEKVFNQKPARTEISLDPDFIIATYASGGGAVGSR